MRKEVTHEDLLKMQEANDATLGLVVQGVTKMIDESNREIAGLIKQAIQEALGARPAPAVVEPDEREEPEDAAPQAGPTPEQRAVGILGTRRPAEQVAPPEEAEPAVRAEEPAEPEKVVKPGEVLAALAARSEQSVEDFRKRRQAAYEGLVNALGERKLRIDPDAEYVDQNTDYADQALHWLVIRVTKAEMTVEEAVQYAIDNSWTEVLTVKPEIYRQMISGFNDAGLWLLKRTRVNGQEIDIQTVIGQAIESGETTLEAAIETARKAGWTRPLREADTSIAAHLRGKADAEAEEARRLRAAESKRKRKRNKK